MKILLATDGSQHSLKAAELVRKLARRMPELEVIVLYVLPRPITIDQAMSAGIGLKLTGYEEEFAVWGERVLDETTAALDLAAQRVTPRLLIGVPGEAICDLAREEEVDLIVMGARGESPLRGLLLGSTSQRALQLAPCPVLVAR